MSILRLVFYTKEPRLKVRAAFPGELLGECCSWKGQIEYKVGDNGDSTMLWTTLLPDLAPPDARALIDLIAARYPVSENYETLKAQCPEIVFAQPTDEWVFYGGTFDPWHLGHQACLDLLPPEKVCFILPDRNPLKDLRNLDPVAAIREICACARFHARQYLVPAFLLLAKKNPTVEWIERLQRSFPKQKLSLLLGFDSFAQLGNWQRHEDLLVALDRIYVVSRLEDKQAAQVALDEVRRYNPRLEVVFLGRHLHEGLSSTALRNEKRTP
jgi:nicotinic acid mononucleotide adenylyltransferase